VLRRRAGIGLGFTGGGGRLTASGESMTYITRHKSVHVCP